MGQDSHLRQWVRHYNINGQSWKRLAKCGGWLGLPWMADHRPGPDHYAQMASICAQCPVTAQCAADALAYQPGGFYAGIWLPWKTANDTADKRLIRRRARDDLRRVAEPVALEAASR